MHLPGALCPTQAGQRALIVVPKPQLTPTLTLLASVVQSCADEKDSLLRRSIPLSKVAKSEFPVCL